MMELFHKQSSSNNVATRDALSSRDDHESSSRNEDCSKKNPRFHCNPREMDLNPVCVIMAEMVGTFILMFSVSGIIASTQLTRGAIGLMEYAATAGLSVVVVIFSIGHISGAHVNPAVTIAFAVFSPFPWSKVPFYIMAQTVGSVAATCVGRSIYGVKADVMVTRPVLGCVSAFWVELIATFIIVFLAASLSDSRSVGHLSAFAIGIVIGLGVLITGPISGGSMNPARSLGPAIVSWDFKDIWVYVTPPVLGAMAGGLMHRLLRLKPRPCTGQNSSPTSSNLTHSFSTL